MKNKLGYLGLLGLLGILGIITDNRDFLGFFGFFIFFRYFTVIPDELFIDNVRKATTPAFFISILIEAISIVIAVISKEKMILLIGFLTSFIVSLFVFLIILSIYEFKESRSE
ncbi:MAG: DUF3796 domain-containing protein [Ruminiclostridium sp.]